MHSWSEHVKAVTGGEPQFVPGKLIDLTDRRIDLADAQATDPNDPFGPGESLAVDIPEHLLIGGARNDHDFDWRSAPDRGTPNWSCEIDPSPI